MEQRDSLYNKFFSKKTKTLLSHHHNLSNKFKFPKYSKKENHTRNSHRKKSSHNIRTIRNQLSGSRYNKRHTHSQESLILEKNRSKYLKIVSGFLNNNNRSSILNYMKMIQEAKDLNSLQMIIRIIVTRIQSRKNNKKPKRHKRIKIKRSSVQLKHLNTESISKLKYVFPTARSSKMNALHSYLTIHRTINKNQSDSSEVRTPAPTSSSTISSDLLRSKMTSLEALTSPSLNKTPKLIHRKYLQTRNADSREDLISHKSQIKKKVTKYSPDKIFDIFSPERRRKNKINKLLNQSVGWESIHSKNGTGNLMTIGDLIKKNSDKKYSFHIRNSKEHIKKDLRNAVKYRLKNNLGKVLRIKGKSSGEKRKQQTVKTQQVLKELNLSFDKSKSKITKLLAQKDLERNQASKIHKKSKPLTYKFISLLKDFKKLRVTIWGDKSYLIIQIF